MRDNNIATLASNIKQGVEARLKELHTATPGIIESFDPVNQLATVQPAIRRIFVTRDGESEILTPTDLPLLINVPVIYPRGGGFSMTFPVKKGDECLLVFCERSIDNWHQTGRVSKPAARRFHSISDAVAYVGLSSVPNKIDSYDNENMEIKKDDGSASIKINSDSTVSIKCSSILVEGDMTVSGNVKLGGDGAVKGIARLGDTVQVGSSTGTIIAASTNHKAT